MLLMKKESRGNEAKENHARGDPVASAETVLEYLCTALATARGVTPESICEMVEAGQEIDSLEGVELVVAVELQFGVQVGDSEITSHLCRSVPRIARMVAAKLGASAP